MLTAAIYQDVVQRQNGCTQCGAYCCTENEVCYKDTYYFLYMCSATATATVISASTETATATATFTVTTEPTYSTSSTSASTSSSSTSRTSSSSSLTSPTSSTITTSSTPSTWTTSSSSPLPPTTPSPSPTPTSQPTGLSTGAQTGIGISAAGIGTALLAALLYFCIRRRRQSRHQQNALSPKHQEDNELVDISGGGGFAQMRERELTQDELDHRRREAEEEREPARYSRSGPNPWALSTSDVEGRREGDFDEGPVGSPFSPEAVGSRQNVGGQDPRALHGNIPPVPPLPTQYYRR
ncbi:hypothetical protein M409DRAFT_55032 [Zasmidium cellare ATCC 36951]|uniref:Uncharacterized protein n=1 Tax=Zasmidium cellare ATCC 36951 TaxID=1080233 RepID=A0A6A6CFY3_ZASCE|nr:uncharacterized protein M409DRAFT_55032 [Zasmidium cellare ATCC 36951]KAF2166157.1 hypothetical protein M409DRAFT_55032 [Zasmidium cellare ATCC 36951]